MSDIKNYIWVFPFILAGLLAIVTFGLGVYAGDVFIGTVGALITFFLGKAAFAYAIQEKENE